MFKALDLDNGGEDTVKNLVTFVSLEAFTESLEWCGLEDE